MPSEGGIKASTFVWSNLRGFVVAICTLPSLIMYIARMQDFDMQVLPDQGTPIAQLGAKALVFQLDASDALRIRGGLHSKAIKTGRPHALNARLVLQAPRRMAHVSF